jgi:hypothetical protein
MTPPLRVNPEVATAYRAAIAANAGRTLLLGVTRELADVAVNLVAIDGSAARVANVWPGDTDRRRALIGDWFNVAVRDRCFAAALGDGILNIHEYPDLPRRILHELSRVMAAGATVALRVFCRPDRSETVTELREQALERRVGNFQAFKWRLAMALVAADERPGVTAAGSDPNIRVQRIREIFNEAFPDRAMLAKATGWSPEDIGTIDLYENSSQVYCFPTEAQFLAVMPDPFEDLRFHRVGTYELAERCPLLLARRRS